MADEEIRLPSKFIQVHALSAPKGRRYICVICNSDGAFLCTQCRTCYCCREHLLLDDLACHAILCERQAAIREILKLPLATRSRPETANRLAALQDECRRVSYLESRRHVLEGNNELALPAAERSLFFAREVHGQGSVDLVPPLLALADVATLAGAKDAARGYVSRAKFLIQQRQAELRSLCQNELKQDIIQNLENINEIRPDMIGMSAEIDLAESIVKKAKEIGDNQGSNVNQNSNLSKSGGSMSNPPQHLTQLKSALQLELEIQLENSLRDEVYRSNSGAGLAYLQSKYWTSQTRVLIAEKDFTQALNTAASALYFATLACGVNSLQTCLQIYSVAKLGLFSEKYSESQSVQALLSAQNIFRDSLMQFYAPMTNAIENLKKERKIPENTDYSNPILKRMVEDYNRAEQMREEDKLSFRADVKEAIQSAVFSVEYIERFYGTESSFYQQCILVIGVGLACVEDVGKDEWSLQSKGVATKLEQTLGEKNAEVEGEFGAAWLLLHVYKCLFG
ncbi:hypothetical protein SS50377_24448 [Spironucleus salmonicida]|uniref:Uncharacterized protein n=1 Tax=Spironucleus salmonicida TaxID=348837 RepID=V6LP38_9EUKA|nr:hypothetical protein SS50377_24448 [Spironucleus salmonicida]|eukprot:EST46003.1 hypothetical protein SS50377_13989 [Spironucleus salmonicida]